MITAILLLTGALIFRLRIDNKMLMLIVIILIIMITTIVCIYKAELSSLNHKSDDFNKRKLHLKNE